MSWVHNIGQKNTPQWKKKRIKYTHLLVSVMAARFLTSFSCFLELRLSGFRLPSSVVSTGSVLTLWFTTDFAVSAQGFKALYEGRTPAVLCSRSLRADLALATRGGRFQCKREPPFRRRYRGSNVWIFARRVDGWRTWLAIITAVFSTKHVFTVFFCW